MEASKYGLRTECSGINTIKFKISTQTPDHKKMIVEKKKRKKKDRSVYVYHVQTITFNVSCNARKLVFGVSDHVRHKPVCAATKDGYKLEILDLRRRGIVLSM